MNKLSIILLSLFAITLLIATAYVAEAKWTNNGNQTFTLSYVFTNAEKQQIQDSFAAMYPQEYDAWKAENKTDQAFVNVRVKSYITEVRQAYETQKAMQAVVVPQISDTQE